MRHVGRSVDAPLVAWRFGVAADAGARPYMEDRHRVVAPFVTPGDEASADGPSTRGFLGVFDGHSGPDAAITAADRLHDVVAAHPAFADAVAAAEAADSGVASALQAAFHAVDAEILDIARTHGGRHGATALVALVDGDRVWTAHAGDSRAVLCRAGGAAHRLTDDHKPDLPAERARVLAAGGAVEWQGCWRVVCGARAGRPAAALAVSRSLGDLDFKEPLPLVTADPSVSLHVLRPGDAFVVLASDGLWDVLSDQTAVDIAAAALAAADTRGDDGDAAAQSAASLVRAALARRSGDNITVVVARAAWAEGE